MKQIIWLFLSLAVVLTASAQAQTFTKPDKAIETIPLEGRTLESFIPRGWEIYSEAKGDLNGDRLPDAAITLGLKEDMKEMLDDGEETHESPPYIVAVLFAKKDGGYRRFAVNGRMYPQYGDAPLSLEIKNGVLKTNQNFRDGWAIDATYSFRYDAAADKLMLIGFDVEHYSRSNIYAGSKTSENYLTGVRLEYAKNDDERKAPGYLQTKKSKIERARISFEEARFLEDENDTTDMVRPF